MTNEEKLAAVERTIEDFRWTRDEDARTSEGAHREYQTYLAMCELAKELRKGVPAKACQAMIDLQGMMDAVNTTLTPLGFSINALRHLAEALIAHWPTVRKALEQFEKEEA